MTPEELGEAIQNGKLNEAAVYLEQQRADAQARGDVSATASVVNDLGVVYYLAEQYPQARAAFESARDGFGQTDDALGRARALGNLARLEEKTGDRKAALALYQQAIDLFHEVNEREDEFATLRSLSQLYLKMGGWIQALAMYDRALMVKPKQGFFDKILHWLYQIPLRMLGMGSA